MVKKFDYIDALRGFAVLAVILVHCGLRISELSPWIKNITDAGAHGVQLFYILSALTLFLSMKQRSNKGEINKREFFLRRFFRIAPLFYIAVLIYTLRNVLLNQFTSSEYPNFDLINFIGTFLFIPNNLNPYWINQVVPGGWSIAVEMAFYLFVPLAFKKILSLKSAVTLTMVTLISAILLNLLFKNIFINIINLEVVDEYLFFWLPNQSSVFCLGFVLYFVITKDMERENKPVGKKYGFAALIITFFSLIILSQLQDSIPYSHFIFSLIFVFIVWLFSRFQIKLLINRVTVLIGKLSFSMYLTHSIILQFSGALLSSFVLPPWVSLLLLFIVTTLATIFISMLTYKYIEKPGIKFGSSFINRRSKPIEYVGKKFNTVN